MLELLEVESGPVCDVEKLDDGSCPGIEKVLVSEGEAVGVGVLGFIEDDGLAGVVEAELLVVDIGPGSIVWTTCKAVGGS